MIAKKKLTPEEIQRAYDTGDLETIIFEREGGFFYALELPIGDDLAAHAACNPGTIRISDAFGAVRWEVKP